jgi:hypothetical protein
MSNRSIMEANMKARSSVRQYWKDNPNVRKDNQSEVINIIPEPEIQESVALLEQDLYADTMEDQALTGE